MRRNGSPRSVAIVKKWQGNENHFFFGETVMMNKKGRTVLGWLATMVLAFGWTTSIQANQVTNGDMEAGGGPTTPPTGWMLEKGIVGVSTDTPSGSGQSMLVNNNSAGAYGGAASHGSIPIEAGAYQLSFSYKGGSPRWVVFDSSYNNLGADNLAASSVWTTYSIQVNIPSGVTSVMLYLYAVSPGTTVLFDDVALASALFAWQPVYLGLDRDHDQHHHPGGIDLLHHRPQLSDGRQYALYRSGDGIKWNNVKCDRRQGRKYQFGHQPDVL
jgi:hypothetical protein